MGGGTPAAKGDVDHEALAQGHVNVIAGACMAIGIKVTSSVQTKGISQAP